VKKLKEYAYQKMIKSDEISSTSGGQELNNNQNNYGNTPNESTNSQQQTTSSSIQNGNSNDVIAIANRSIELYCSDQVSYD
jgi:hypothetical protein